MDPSTHPDAAAAAAPATRLAQLLGTLDAATGGVVPPLVAATTFLRDPDNQYRKGLAYGRDDNPGVRTGEAVLASLEGGPAALLWGSGMAAASAVFQALPAGVRVVAPRVMYWGLRKWLRETGPRLGLDVAFVDTTDLDALRAAVEAGPTALVWVETPANPTWAVTDLAAAAAIAHAAGALLAVDNTVPTPLLTRPIEHGADLVMHSATKYLNGHSDVLAGVLVTRAEGPLWERLRTLRHDGGAILGAFEAWLLLRGLRTLHLRVRQSCAGAMHVAAALQEHPAVERVLYPGLPTHAGHTLTARQMTGGFGGMLSIVVRGGAEAAIATAARVRLWVRATSLGGVESLIEHRASIEGEGSPAAPGLLRLSVGIEDPGDLIADLERALEGAGV
jgi:cystathionine gamma-synthase